MDLRQRWLNLVARYSDDEILHNTLWEEIESNYQESGRAYHNLNHIQELFALMDQADCTWKSPDTVAFSIWYHDIIYNARKRDNEYKSANLAKKRLQQLGLPANQIKKIHTQILATQNHQIPSGIHDPDLPFFLDFDLEVLSRDWKSYQTYTQQIRSEYAVYPMFLYKIGRKKALTHFIKKTKIYHTPIFQSINEAQARANILKEIKKL